MYPTRRLTPVTGTARRATQTAAAEMYPYKRTQRVLKKTVDICVDGEEGKADGSSDKNDKKDDEEEEWESGEVDSSSGSESLSLSVVVPHPPRCRRHPYVLTSTDSSDFSSDSSDSSSSGSSSDSSDSS